MLLNQLRNKKIRAICQFSSKCMYILYTNTFSSHFLSAYFHFTMPQCHSTIKFALIIFGPLLADKISVTILWFYGRVSAKRKHILRRHLFRLLTYLFIFNVFFGEESILFQILLTACFIGCRLYFHRFLGKTLALHSLSALINAQKNTIQYGSNRISQHFISPISN